MRLLFLLPLAAAQDPAEPLRECPAPPSGWVEVTDVPFLAHADYRQCNYVLSGSALYAAMNDGFGGCAVHPSFAAGSDWAVSSGLMVVEGIAQSAYYASSVDVALRTPVNEKEGCNKLVSRKGCTGN